MALTDAQKELVKLYTGRATLTDDSDVLFALRELEAKPAAEPVVLQAIADCESASTQIRTYIPTLALAAQDGAIQLRAAYTLGTLQAFGRMASGRLCGYLSLPMGPYDPWASALPAQPHRG